MRRPRRAAHRRWESVRPAPHSIVAIFIRSPPHRRAFDGKGAQPVERATFRRGFWQDWKCRARTDYHRGIATAQSDYPKSECSSAQARSRRNTGMTSGSLVRLERTATSKWRMMFLSAIRVMTARPQWRFAPSWNRTVFAVGLLPEIFVQEETGQRRLWKRLRPPA
jgi:hypothetical protein